MSLMTMELPDWVSEVEAKFQLAVRLFQLGRLSCGQAAELAGYSKPTFIELLGQEGVPIIDYPPEDLANDLSHA